MRFWVSVWLWLGAVTSIVATEVPNVLWKKSFTSSAYSAAVAISHDGTLAVTAATNGIQIWRMAAGTLVHEFAADYSGIGELVFSSDDSLLASSGWERNVKLWRTSDWTNVVSISVYDQFSPLAFSPSGVFIAIGNHTNIELRLVMDGALVRSWPATTGRVRALRFSPDGRRLACGAGYRGLDTHLKVGDTETSALLVNVPTAQRYGIGCLAYSPDGRFLATGNFEYGFEGPTQLWQAENGALVRTFPDDVQALAFSPDSRLLLGAGTNVVCWAVHENIRIALWLGFNSLKLPSALAFSPDGGTFLYSGARAGALVAKTPLWISSVSRTGSVTALEWLGGQSPFMVQRRIGMNGQWQIASEMLNTNSTKVGSVSDREFYRVVSIGRE